MVKYKVKIILKIIKNPYKLLYAIICRIPFVAKCIPDKQYIRLAYRSSIGKKLNLNNPQNYNEKLQWLKLNDRNPLYIDLVDKFQVKRYVSEIIGEKYIVPTLGVWSCFDEINFDELPNQFVLKCTHDSGGIIICKDKKNFNIIQARKKITKLLKKNYYWQGREWPYKNVKPRIIAEKYMVDESGAELKDYKLFSFDGKVKLIQVDYDRFLNHKRNLYSIKWDYIDAEIEYPTDKNHIINKPKCLDELIMLSEKLSEGFPHLRTDFYIINGKIYFGELTFYHGSGLERFRPESLGMQMGEWINLKKC